MSQTKSSFLHYLQVVLGVSLILYLGRVIFIPLAFGLLIAVVLYPGCRWLESHRFSRSFSIAVALLGLTIVTTALLVLLSWQVVAFEKDFPQMVEKLSHTLQDAQQWMVNTFLISLDMQTQWLHRAVLNLSDRVGSVLSGTLATTANLLFFVVMVPLFAALILYYRSLLFQSLSAWVGDAYRLLLVSVVHQTVHTYYNYIKGLLWVYLIVGILNSLGLALLGIRQPILFGLIASVLTIIPYVGIAVGSLLPMSVAWLMYDSIWYPLGVAAVFAVVQYLEANVIFPLVVGSQLKINTLAALVSLFVGGVIWGVSGMVLFLPFAAILKIVSDAIPEWKPVSILLSPLESSGSPKSAPQWLSRLSKRFRF
jgi:predicted PurR-regulated permease PerM